jgi:hypothetical protein
MQFTPEMIGTSDQIFARDLEQISNERGQELREVIADIGRRNLEKSGINISNQLRVHEKFLRRQAEARAQSLMSVLQQANLPLTEEDVNYIIDRVGEITARGHQNISDAVERLIRQVGINLPADWIRQNLERTTSSIVSTTRRNLNIEKGMQALAVQSRSAIRGRSAFVVMPFNPDLDFLFRDGIVPAVLECGLEPYRVDREEFEETISEVILDKIRTSRIVLGDLTFERPNCYFEIGYAMAIQKPLILSAREDHDPRRPLRNIDDPKVHFDLDAHKITFWNPGNVNEFRGAITERIRKHLAL